MQTNVQGKHPVRYHSIAHKKEISYDPPCLDKNGPIFFCNMLLSYIIIKRNKIYKTKVSPLNKFLLKTADNFKINLKPAVNEAAINA